MGFNPSNSNVPGPTKAGSSTSDVHQFTGSVYISGNVYAEEYHVHVVSSSISYASGSHKFGDSADDLQQFSGSVEISGSLIVEGAPNDKVQFHTELSSSQTISASYFVGDGSQLENLPGGGGGSGAPTGAQYVVLSANGDLSAERVLTAGDGISLVDAGANSTITVSASAAGGDQAIQFSSGSASKLSGSSHLTFNYDNDTLTLSGALKLSGTLTMEGGDATPLLVLDDSDASAQIGRTHLGYDGTNGDMAVFAHQDNANQTDFALRQRANGQTELNAKSGQSISFKVASATKMQIGSAGDVGLGSNYAPSFLFDVSGSTRFGRDEHEHVHRFTGSIEQSGSTVILNIPSDQSASFAVSGNQSQHDPEGGLYFAVDTANKFVRIPPGVVVDEFAEINFGTGTLFTAAPDAAAADASIKYDGHSLLISGTDNGVIITGSIFAPHIASGAIAGLGSYVGVNAQNELVLTSTAGGGHAEPEGSDTQFQYNNDGEFGGASSFTYNDSSHNLTVVDDAKLQFGTGGESFIMYKETTSNRLYISGAAAGTVFSSSVHMANHENGDVVSLIPDDAKYTFIAEGGENSGFIVSGTTVLTGAAFGPGHDDPSGVIFRVEGGSRFQENEGNPILFCQATASAGYVGIGTSSPQVELDVVWDKVTSLPDDVGGGEVVYFGTGSMAKGALYFLQADGGWLSASAHGTGSGNDAMLGIALGNGANPGMLIRGWFHADSYWSGSFVKGGAVYIASGSAGVANTLGKFSSSAPTEEGSYARIVGHATPNGNVIYFNPSPDWVELA